MSNNFGLYFGNSTASIAQFREDGKVEILANEAGERVTAAVVILNSKEQVVGSVAGATSYSLAPLTVRNNKMLLDSTLTAEEISSCRANSQVKIEGDIFDDLTYNIFETDKKPLVYTPEQVATLIFQKLYGIGLGATPGQKSLNCVLCVPRHWNNESRDIVRRAATTAGWVVRQIINEPTAALLAYKIGFEKPPVDSLVVVYRLGGVSCDATVLKVMCGFQAILSHVRHCDVGGKDIVKSLTDHLAEEFKRKFHLEPSESRKSMWKLKIAASGILHTLSTLPSCSRFIESVCDGIDFNVTVSRARLDALITPLVPKFTAPISEALRDAGVDSSDVSKVVLCGGALKIPKLKSVVASFFSCESCSSFNPDEVYATGAAQQAGLLTGLPNKADLSSPTVQIPFLNEPITLKVNEKEVRIEKNYLPTSDYFTMELDSSSVTMKAVQNRQDEQLQGEASMEFENRPKEVEFHVKVLLNDEIHVSAVDTVTKDIYKASLKLTR